MGFAFWFLTYSTWRGQPTLFLEDLFVIPEARGKGVGKALMQFLARTALEKGCARFMWNVLDWNQPSIDFYESLGAKVLREWLTVRLDGAALEQLAGRSVSAPSASGADLAAPARSRVPGDSARGDSEGAAEALPGNGCGC